MRATAVSALVSLICLGSLLGAVPAAANSSINVIWRDTPNTNTVISSSGAVITVFGNQPTRIVADIVFTAEAGKEIVGLFFTILFDEDGQNELNSNIDNGTICGTDPGGCVGGFEFSNVAAPPAGGAGNFSPLAAGLENNELADAFGFGQITRWDSTATLGTTADGPFTVTLGSVAFTTNVNNLEGWMATGLPDVRVFVDGDGPFDVILDEGGNRCVGQDLPFRDCPYDFGGAFVNTPEPTTAALLALGLGLGVAVRRRS